MTRLTPRHPLLARVVRCCGVQQCMLLLLLLSGEHAQANHCAVSLLFFLAPNNKETAVELERER